MIKGFSRTANKLLSTLSQQEGHSHRSDLLYPEHILLAMICNKTGTAYRMLELLQVNILSLEVILEHFLMEKRTEQVSGDLAYSRRLITLVDVASVESRSMCSDYIGTEHLLIAAAREEGSLFQTFLINNSLTLTDLRRVKSSIDEEGKDYEAQITRPKPLEPGKFVNYGPRPVQPPKKSFIDEYSVDLTQKAREGKIDSIFGREKEIQRVIQILVRRTKNNPVLIGEPGVGKTAIVEGLALKIAKSDVPVFLLNKRILSLDLALLVAGTKFRGEFEERLKKVMKDVTERKDIILFIDEIHTLIGAGGSEGGMDAANMIKPALSRGEIQCIGSTTTKEYAKYFEKDSSLIRRFQNINVEEPSVSETTEILFGLAPYYEKYHGVKYSSEALKLTALYSQRYISGRFLPDKAIDVMDEAGAVKKIGFNSDPSELEKIEISLAKLKSKKEELVKNQEFEEAADTRDEIARLQKKRDEIALQISENEISSANIVTEQDVCDVISTMTGIPLESLDKNEMARLMNMENEIHKTVIAQDEAVSKISSAIRRSRSGVSSIRRPMGSFIFLGPTGVGKTLLAKTLSKFLFGKENAIVRVDMSDFMEKHSVSRLVGAPPGYIGYEEGGSLTEQIRRNPYSVVLLDEIEKAHQDVFNLLLQILEEGELTDNLGHTVSFRNTVIIMTSNAGVRQISNENRLGFSIDDSQVMSYQQIKSSAMSELKRIMSPEILNRVDDVVVFKPLSRSEIFAIMNEQVRELSERLEEKNISIALSKSAKNYLVEHGYEPSMGARPMRRLIQREIEDGIANLIISGKCQSGDLISIECKNGSLSLKVKVEKEKVIEHSVSYIGKME
ncbi:MAG: ATP-dependent Clp protease ATP-binding subunit [Treponemataceae bacterium]|nr:ATP-dependent Clp protease ATP-binding subunit [Treponemataceae bacterium]